MNNNRFYLKMSLLFLAAFFVWLFGSPKAGPVANNLDRENYPLKDKPAALTNFVVPTIAVFNDSQETLPKRNWNVSPLELGADAAIAMKIDGGRIYYNKNMDERRPMASLTKLMTAVIVAENYDLNQPVKILKSDVEGEGASGDLKWGEELTVRSLLNIMLIDSSNDAAVALARQNQEFIAMMNKKAKELGLTNTHYENPDGIDADNHYSSAFDVAKFFIYIINNRPEIFVILSTQNAVVYSTDGKIEHRLQNTNELLGRVSEVKAGKTGRTDNAGGCLALLISGIGRDNIITVILRSSDRFGESEKLIQWLKAAYIWSH